MKIINFLTNYFMVQQAPTAEADEKTQITKIVENPNGSVDLFFAEGHPINLKEQEIEKHKPKVGEFYKIPVDENPLTKDEPIHLDNYREKIKEQEIINIVQNLLWLQIERDAEIALGECKSTTKKETQNAIADVILSQLPKPIKD